MIPLVSAKEKGWKSLEFPWKKLGKVCKGLADARPDGTRERRRRRAPQRPFTLPPRRGGRAAGRAAAAA